MKDWETIMNAEAEIKRPLGEQRVFEFLAGGAVKFGADRIQLHWTDHGSLIIAHNARMKNRNFLVGVCGVPSTLGMLTVIRDTIMSMLSRFDGKHINSDRLPGKILWLAPKADMSQIFRRAIFTINGLNMPVRAVSSLVSLDLLEQTPAQTTVAFLRDFWRVKEAIMAHSFESIVIDDPYGQFCNTPEITADILNTIFRIKNHPPVVAVVPVRSLPELDSLLDNESITLWPWTSELSKAVEPTVFADEARAYMNGSIIKRSQIVFDATSLLPPTVVVCNSSRLVITTSMEEILKTSSRLAQEAYKLAPGAERRLTYEARAAALSLEGLCMPITIHEATTTEGTRWKGYTITERLNNIQKSLFNCSTAIRDDLSILLDHIADLMNIMKTEVPKWRRLVSLLQTSLAHGYTTAIAVPNLRIQEALLKALRVQFPGYKNELPWEICTYSSVPRLGQIDELVLVNMPTFRQSWLLRYPVCADRKILVWPFQKELAVWLCAPQLSNLAENKRIKALRELSMQNLEGLPERPYHTLPKVGVLEGESKVKVYYDIPKELTFNPFTWSLPCEEDELNDEDKEEEEEFDESQLERNGPQDLDYSMITDHLVIYLKDGGFVYALDEDRFDVIKGKDVVDAAALSLEIGQIILMVRGQSYIKLRNILLEGVDKKYNSIWFEDDWNKWRQMCRQIPRNGKGFHDFIDKLRELGCDKEVITVKYWLSGAIMAPLDLKDIRRVALAAGDDMMVYYSHRFFQGMRELRGRHIAFGRWLKRILLTQEKWNDLAVIDPDLDFTVGDLRTSVTKHEILRIERHNGPPMHRTGEIIRKI